MGLGACSRHDPDSCSRVCSRGGTHGAAARVGCGHPVASAASTDSQRRTARSTWGAVTSITSGWGRGSLGSSGWPDATILASASTDRSLDC